MVVSFFGLILSRRKIFYATCLAILLVVWAAVVALDPRFHGMNPFAGGYESEALSNVFGKVEADSLAAVGLEQRWKNLVVIFTDHVPSCFVGQELPWKLGAVLTGALVVTAIAMIRKQPLWALLILFTLPVTTLMTTTPRYYVMILPILLATSLVMVNWFRAKLSGGWGDLVLLALLLPVTLCNIAANSAYIYSQHRTDFYTHYRSGEMIQVMKLAEMIKRELPENARLISPSASIIKYLSGRDVLLEREALPVKKSVRDHPLALQENGIAYAVYPAKLYSVKNPQLARLIERGVVWPTEEVSRVDGMILAKVKIVVPPGEWRDQPRRYFYTQPPASRKRVRATVPFSTQPTIKKRPKPTTAEMELKARKQNSALKLRKQKRQRKSATTQPVAIFFNSAIGRWNCELRRIENSSASSFAGCTACTESSPGELAGGSNVVVSFFISDGHRVDS
jgi:hypothetical protein